MSLKWMSRSALIVSAVSLLVLLTARAFLGGWISFLWWPLGLFLVSLFAGLILDIRFYWSLFTLKTAKEGLGVGFTLLILITILASLAYLTLRFDKTFDLTEEKLYSLSDQTLNVLNSMKGVQITVFYKGKQSLSVKNALERYLRVYKQNADHLQFKYIDAHLNNRKAKSYLESLSDRNTRDVFVFVEYQSKKARVEEPIDESSILSALIQVSRRVDQNIYFTSGHGERDMFAAHAQGLSAFASALKEESFNVVELNFENQEGVPEEASALMILGPAKPFFEQEIKWIKEYIERGGRVFMALDPGGHQNLTALLKETLNVDFKNNFVINPRISLAGKSQTAVIGRDYNVNHLITKDFSGVRGFATSIFDSASEISFTEQTQIKISPLVYSGDGVALSSLDEEPSSAQPKSFVLAVAAEEEKSQNADEASDNSDEKEGGKSNTEKEEQQKTADSFKVVVFGDSDFLTNSLLNLGVHKDMALNVLSYLADREDLLNIRPKQPKGTQMVLTQSYKIMMIIAAILLPLICFICAFFIWVRRNWA